VRGPTVRSPSAPAGHGSGFGFGSGDWLPSLPVTTAPPAWAPPGTISPLDDKLGIEILDYDPDRVVATMPVEGNQQPYGLLHGGATCALVETVGSWAAALHAGPEQKVVGIELNASYIRSATSGAVTAVCTPVRRGRTLATFLVEVTDDQGRPTASARLTCMILTT
jgi:1,4-dihydroxy-2-naphthoyl-CoA hydrolase